MGVIAVIGLLLLLCDNRKTNKYQSILDCQGYSECKILKLGRYKKIKKSKVNVSKEDIEEYKKLELEKYGEFEDSDELIIREGCYVDVDIKQSIEGKVVDEDKGYIIKVGLGKFDSNIEKKLIGLKVGDKLDYNLNGTTYCVKIKKIKNYNLPNIDNEFIEKNYMEEGLKNVKEFEKWIYNNCYENKEVELKNKEKNIVLDDIIENSKFDIPNNVVATKAVNIYHKYKDVSYAYGYDNIEDYYLYELKKDKDEFYEFCCDEARNEIQECLVICEMADKNGIVVSESEIKKYCKKNKVILKEDNTKNQIIYMIIKDKVINYLLK